MADAEQGELLMGGHGLLRFEQQRDPDGLEEPDLGQVDDQVRQCGITAVFVEAGANGVVGGEIEVTADRHDHDRLPRPRHRQRHTGDIAARRGAAGSRRGGHARTVARSRLLWRLLLSGSQWSCTSWVSGPAAPPYQRGRPHAGGYPIGTDNHFARTAFTVMTDTAPRLDAAATRAALNFLTRT